MMPLTCAKKGGRIVIDPVRPAEFDLANLLAGITPENVYAEVSFGAAAGKEAF